MISSRGLLVPLYIYPSTVGAWAPVIAAKQAYPSVPFLAVANPASGPGPSIDPNYAAAIKALQLAGVLVLGYVATTYGAKPIADAMSEMDSWLSWYRVDGYFFDEVDTLGQEAYLSALKTHAGGKLTVGNPGTEIPASYVGTLDDFCVFEGSGFPSLVGIGGDSCISYAVSPLKTLPLGYDYLFATDQPLATAYSVMSPYLVQIANLLAVPTSRPQIAEWVGFYRKSGQPLHIVNGSIWLESIDLPSVNDNGVGKGAGYSSLMLNCVPNDRSGLLYQAVLQFAPSYVNWTAQVVYGDKALHTFQTQLQSLGAASFGRWLVDFQYNDEIMSIRVLDSIGTGQTIYAGSHSLPGNYRIDPADTKVWPNAPISCAYLAAGGYGNGSAATYQAGTVLKAEYHSDAGVDDLAFAMFNGETPPGGMNSIGEFANLYCAYPYVAAPHQISFLMTTLTPDIAPTW